MYFRPTDFSWSMEELIDLASTAGLPNPVGRAAYARNRHLNGSARRWDKTDDESALHIMTRAKPETARKWGKQFRAGINLKKFAGEK